VVESTYLVCCGVFILQLHQRSGLKTLHRSLFTFENLAENFLGTACSSPVSAPKNKKRDTLSGIP
jgi:hypothetical protein